MAIDTTEFNGNGAYPRAGARDACMQRQEQQEAVSAAVSSSRALRPEERETEQLHAAGSVEKKAELHASFPAIVAPLEAAAGKPLNGSGLPACLAAFDESPEGFERIAGKALERAQVNPLGLLIKMVRDGDHLEESRPATPRGRSAPRKPSRCPSCASVWLDKNESLIIVTKDLVKALSERDNTCGICDQPVRPDEKGAVGELGRRRYPEADELDCVLMWCHVKCLNEDRAPPICPECHTGAGQHDDGCKLAPPPPRDRTYRSHIWRDHETDVESRARATHARASAAAVCKSCGTGDWKHVDGCELAPGSQNREAAA